MINSQEISDKDVILFKKEFRKIFSDNKKFSLFINKLSNMVANNNNITENPMRDGVIIGFMIVKEKQIYGILFDDEKMYSEDTITICKSVFMYMIENWEKLKKINKIK